MAIRTFHTTGQRISDEDVVISLQMTNSLAFPRCYPHIHFQLSPQRYHLDKNTSLGKFLHH